MGESVRGFRKKDKNGKVIPDDKAIRKWVEEAYKHRDTDSPFIYKNRREDVKGKKELGDWK